MAQPIILIIGHSVVEDAASIRYINFDITLSEPSAQTVQVSFRTIAGTALPGIDYAEDFGTITFAAGETSRTIQIRVWGDTADELDEHLALELYNPTGGSVFAGGVPTLRATGIILDDDGIGSDRAVFVSDVRLVEGDAGTRQAVFEIRLSEPAATATSFTYSTVDGSALAGSDYTAKSGTVTIAVGQQSVFVSVDVRGDLGIEGSEQFSLAVAPVTPGVTATTGTATVLDDDAGTPVISLSGGSVVEDAASIRYINFDITLSEPSAGTVQVSFRTIAGTALAGIDYQEDFGTVTFAAGQTSHTIQVRVWGDTADELDEHVALELYNPTGGSVFAGGVPTLRATGVILDDDGTGSDRALFVSDVRLVEGDAGIRQAVFEIRLSEPAATAMSFTYSTVDGSALAGSDYTAKSGTVTFAVGQQSAFVSIDVRGDLGVEGSEQFSLAVVPVTPGIAATTGTATVLDDDAGTPVISLSGGSVVEDAASIRYINFDITLSEPSAGTVQVSFRTIAGTALAGIDYQEDFGTVTFAAGQTSRTIQIRVWGDTVLEHNETLSLELYNPTNGARLAGGVVTLRAVGGIIEDDGNLPGTSGNDTLLGTPFADSLSGLAGNDVLEGNDGHDILSGGAGNDILRGGDGIDTLDGGDGSDQIDGGRAPDRIDGGAGTDLATYASANAAVSINLLTGRGSGGDAQGDVLAGIENLTGSSFADVLTGNAGANVLSGGAGADQMAGGGGNDTYVVDNAGDVVTEAGGAGTDTVQASISWTLGANLESLTLIGAAAINGTGNTLANVITGNAAANVLSGGAGADQLAGGAGNDTYVVGDAGDVVTEAAGAGTDSVQAWVSWTLGANIETLTLLGGATTGTGNSLANIITGNALANVLNGGAGADQMAGGTGNDTYVVDNAGDVVTEAAGAGTDTVQTSISWTLGANLENLTLIGGAAINGTGNALANVITGNSAANVLRGGAGADVLNGGGGADTASYYDGTVGVVVDLAAGTGSGGDAQGDTLVSIENVNGSQGNDTLIGNAGANVLNGWTGRDTLTGGAGADRFVLSSVTHSPAAPATRDTITDFSRVAGDRIDLSQIDANTTTAGGQAFVFIGSALYSAAGQLRFAQSGGQTIVAGDTNGDGVSDFHIALNGTIALLSGDFVL